MPKVENIPMGARCWMDRSTSDAARAVAFYGGLFGWNVIDTGEEFGHYHMANKGDAGIAGLMPKDDTQRDQPDAWMVYLAVPDAAATAALGVETADMEMAEGPRYLTINVNGDQQAGIMDASGFMAEGVPRHWKVYYGVDDTDRALALAQELGGSVLSPAEDTPFGRMAKFADPLGATFCVISVGE